MYRIFLTAVALVSTLAMSICDDTPAPPIPNIADCGNLKATVTGRIKTLGLTWSSPPAVSATLSGTAKGAVTWVASSGTGSAMDGTTASGTATGSPTAPSFTATGTNGGSVVTVTGTITVGSPCTGKGNWSLNTTPVSSGTWSIP